MIKTREQFFNEIPLIDGKIAELGVFEGEFSRYIINTGKFSKIFLVDIFEGDMYSGDKNGENGKYINLTTAYNNITEIYKSDARVDVIKNTSTNFLSSLPDQFLDIVYIDADHSYEGVKNDLALSRLKVKDGGFISGHDYNIHMFPGVVQAVDEFMNQYKLSIEYTTDDKLSSFFIKQRI